MSLHHYVELRVSRPDKELMTRIPTESWEASKRSMTLLIADFFPEDETIWDILASGNNIYTNTNDLGDFMTIEPVISSKKLSIGECMAS